MKDVIYVENHYFVTAKENSIKFRNVIDKSEKFYLFEEIEAIILDRKSTRLNSSHSGESRMPSSA